MPIQVKRDYRYQCFDKGQLKQFAIKLARFFDISPSKGYIFLRYKEDDFETSTKATIDDLENICKIGTTTLHSLAFQYDTNMISISLSWFSKGLGVYYVIFGDMEYTKKLVFFVENTLGLIRLSEQEIKELTKRA